MLLVDHHGQEQDINRQFQASTSTWGTCRRPQPLTWLSQALSQCQQDVFQSQLGLQAVVPQLGKAPDNVDAVKVVELREALVCLNGEQAQQGPRVVPQLCKSVRQVAQTLQDPGCGMLASMTPTLL